MSGMLSKQLFREWLESRIDAVVGMPVESDKCPIASYVRERMNVHDVSVGAFDISIGGEVVRLPRWAVKFVRRVDACFYVRCLRGEDCLAMLAEIQDEE